MGDLIVMVRVLLLLFLFRSCSGVIRALNDTEYAKMPPLYSLDEYKKCMTKPGGLYCLSDFSLYAEGKSDLMDMINEYSALNYAHYNHSLISRGICVSQTCKDILQKYTSNGTLDVNVTLERCLNKTVWNKYKLQAKLSKNYYCDKENEKSNIDLIDVLVLVTYFIIITLNIAGSLYDSFFSKDGKGNIYLMAFSLRRNWNKLFASPNEVSEPRLQRLKQFNGIKTVLMVCVILAHVNLIAAYTYTDNPVFVENTSEDYFKQILLNGTLVTHGFFVMAGFLLSYNFQLYAEKHKVSWLQLPKSLLLRWLRLTPLLALMIATQSLMRHIGSGPLWTLLVGSESQICRQYWWSNLLFFNNYLRINTCLLQTWYIASDFQLYILGMVICMAARTPRAQKIAIFVTLIIAMLIVGAQTYFMNLTALVLQTPEKYRSFYAFDDTYKLLFTCGHANISTYTMGLGAGFLTYHLQIKGKDFSKYKRYGWIFLLVFPIGLLVILSGSIFYTEKVYSTAFRVIYAMTHKQIFQGVVVLFMLANIFKIENIQRRVIEWHGFTWTSRLTYGVFLVHNHILRYLYGIQSNLLHLSEYLCVQFTAITTVSSFIVAAILWLGVEAPLATIIKAVFQPAKPTETKDTKEVRELPVINTAPPTQNNEC